MSSTLAPPGTSTPNSPGSSVFDLPTQPANYARPTVPNASIPLQAYRRLSSQTITDNLPKREPSYVVVSGGTGCNSIVSAFGTECCYVLPVSDDGGSSSEIIRVLGGPSIGDVRSRLIRLIPRAAPGSPEESIRTLLSHRFPASVTVQEAREAWNDIVQGRSPLWAGIPEDRKETIRGFLVYLENEISRRALKHFSFLNGSVGNYFLAGAAMFFRSLPSAIFLFSSITNSQAHILPVIVTNHTVTIAAELDNGDHIFGQCEISHPVQHPPVIQVDYSSGDAEDDEDDEHEEGADGVLPPAAGNVAFEQESKGTYSPLPSRISRVYYINAYGQEITPAPNPGFLRELATRDVLVYSCGSLWTSVMPCLELRGVASAIARSPNLRAKVLLLNSANDRETDGYTATDYLSAITRTLNHPRVRAPRGKNTQSTPRPPTEYPCSAFVTHLVYLRGTSVAVDEQAVADMGVRCIAIEPAVKAGSKSAEPLFNADGVRVALRDILDEVDG